MSNPPIGGTKQSDSQNKDSPAEHYAPERVWNRVNVFHKKRIYNKEKYHQIQITIIVTSAFITLINAIIGGEIWIPIVSSVSGALIVILTGILQLKKYQENWLLFGTAEEKLRREYYLWKNKAGQYSSLEDDARLRKLVETVEDILSSQYTEFFKTQKLTSVITKNSNAPE